MNISVIGSGSWGCAIAAVLADNGHNVCLWSYTEAESERLKKDKGNKKHLPGLVLPETITYTWDLKRATEAKDVIVMVTPSAVIGETAAKMRPFVAPGTVVVCASKGFDSITQKTLTETIGDHIPQCCAVALSGPSHAEEVAQKIPTTLVAACEDLAVAQRIQELFMTEYLRVYTNTDVLGVELGGALKNIIALCAGISDGLGLGDNTKAALMTRGMTEIARLGTKMGASLSTFSGLSGMGDLIVTCTSMHSRNRRAGILIGQGKTPQEAMEEVEMVVEGVYATKEAYKLSERLGIEMPITRAAYSVLFENACVKDAVKSLMTRDKKQESDSGFVSK